MTELTPLEYRVLEECAGMRDPSPLDDAVWGMAERMKAAKLLKDSGLIKFVITPAGRKALEDKYASITDRAIAKALEERKGK